MSTKPVVYRLESQRIEGAAWEPVLDEKREPITFKGRGSKSQALTMAALLLRYPSFYGLRVRRDAEVVGYWTKQGGVSQ